MVSENPQPGDNLDQQERINRETEIDSPPEQLDPYHPDLPRFARPASTHSGGVNVVFADGHNQFLRDDIDYLVYQRLLTSNGKNCEDPEMHRGKNTAGLSNSDPIKIFRLAPVLSERDYQ